MARSIKRNMPKLQKRIMNDYLSNLYSKYIVENPKHNLSFSTFARMRPSYYVLANVDRGSCLCTQHQNIALKLNWLKKYNKDIPVHPDFFIKNQREGDSDALLQKIDVDRCEYETWKKVFINIKSKSSEENAVHKMKIVKEVTETKIFKQLFYGKIERFRDQAKGI